ncbi:Tvp14 [Trichomonas vaginalis G3]|uniref:Tvp14 n=2 Tax=Trichomonas vaginalis TaxID=5722 RepID=A0A8U0WQ08_TRIV3|nr:Tvp14 (fibronectin-like protein 1, flp1) [Trichomonas vaginalis G3]AAF73223.1 Tvp14 [Trichomonas vaginalis]EAY04293.1 Tvp14 [Trichomonas vaginalis G3]KAI5498254.1 Tvp14 (fibronectin-like protein 1, flp1) [Trichomonas vaginalis G3]|eukprot:XP_001316516.1 Tvp14 [Trichomonas vaginalis G3]
MATEETTYDLLSRHEVIAEFQGLQHIPCRFMTSLCPDRCDHATDVALFKVLEYTKYEKPGEYGDPKHETIYVDVKKKVFNQDPKIQEYCKTLEVGKKYRVCYDHLYLNRNGSRWPERPCTEVTPL